MEIQGMLGPFVEFAAVYRIRAIALGFCPEAAEEMAVRVHDLLVTSALTQRAAS
jgi:hypothetical protein